MADPILYKTYIPDKNLTVTTKQIPVLNGNTVSASFPLNTMILISIFVPNTIDGTLLTLENTWDENAVTFYPMYSGTDNTQFQTDITIKNVFYIYTPQDMCSGMFMRFQLNAAQTQDSFLNVTYRKFW